MTGPNSRISPAIGVQAPWRLCLTLTLSVTLFKGVVEIYLRVHKAVEASFVNTKFQEWCEDSLLKLLKPRFEKAQPAEISEEDVDTVADRLIRELMTAFELENESRPPGKKMTEAHITEWDDLEDRLMSDLLEWGRDVNSREAMIRELNSNTYTSINPNLHLRH